MTSRYALLCLASGLAWMGIAFVLGHELFPRNTIWGGLVIAPLIGLTVGLFYRGVLGRSLGWRVAMSLVSLYVAAALFGLGVGLFDAFQGLEDGSLRGTPETILQNVLGVLWGLTFTGYVIALWPLAFWNHWLVGRFAGTESGQESTPIDH